MPIIDRYIIKKYFGTLGFMLGLLSIVVLVIDVQAKVPRIESNGFEVSYFLVNYYPFWIIYLIVTFLSILVFISVIFFTSRMANNTEIVAIISSGASFHRFARPYLVTSLIIAILSLGINHFILPWSNMKKNVLEPYTYGQAKRENLLGISSMSVQVSANEYIFLHSYDKRNLRGSGLTYQKYDKNKKMVYQLTASEMYWDASKKVFVLNDFLEKIIHPNDSEGLNHGQSMQKSFGQTPAELFPNELSGQTKMTPELINFIHQEQKKGNSNLNSYLNDLYSRTSMPVSIVILTFLALSLSSQKKRGGLGANLAIGIALAFVFVFSFEALKVVSANKTLPPLLAMWLPNIVFGIIAAILYIRRANQ